jgi:hypothetical protein
MLPGVTLHRLSMHVVMVMDHTGDVKRRSTLDSYYNGRATVIRKSLVTVLSQKCVTMTCYDLENLIPAKYNIPVPKKVGKAPKPAQPAVAQQPVLRVGLRSGK